MKSMPPATDGPMDVNAPPRASMPSTVLKSCNESKSQMIVPFCESYARRWPSFEAEKTTPGRTVTGDIAEALQPGILTHGGLGGGVCQMILPVGILSANRPPPASALPSCQSERGK